MKGKKPKLVFQGGEALCTHRPTWPKPISFILLSKMHLQNDSNHYLQGH